VAGENNPADVRPVEPDHLLTLALSRPQEALAGASAVLATRPGPHAASIARQARGVVHRDFGDLALAIREFRAALRLARQSGRADREADVLASLGLALAFAGRSEQALAALDLAVEQSRGAAAGRVLIRRASMFWMLGRYPEALRDSRRAVSLLRRAGSAVWEARALSHRGMQYLATGDTPRADADLAAAERLFASAGQDMESAVQRHNRGLVAFARGDLPTALGYLDQARHRYEELGTPMPDVAIDRCSVLLAAGLAQEAFRDADAAAARLEQTGGQATKKAELLFAVATAALAAGDAAAARERAGRARRLFRAQRRDWWAARAELVLVQSRYAGGDHGAAVLARAEQVAATLDELRADEAARAHLLAGLLARERGRHAEADHHLEHAARARRRGPLLTRSVGWLAKGLLAEARGEVRATLAACERGLQALDEHRLTLGATELRAHVTAHGTELAALAHRQALRRGDARRLLVWSERWRATALAVPPVRPPDDRELAAELSALREVVRLLEAARAEGRSTAVHERERRRLEQSVRARTLRTLGTAGPQAERFRLDELVAGLGETRLVELVEVDGVLHAIVVVPGRVRLHTVGALRDAEREVELARFVLRRVAYGRTSARAGADPAQVGRRLERVLLGPAATELGDGPVVVVPPGRLHAVPWALLPSLADRVLSVAPSAATWLRTRRARAPARRRVTLVLGPGLDAGGAEVPRLAERYTEATVLGEGTATADRVLAAIDGAWLAHVAAHGVFRADSPLFSALWLDDGPLTVHDFERLRRAPYRLVLSSCDSGVAAPVGSDELLGLVSGLVPLGAAGILASVVPVNDAATVPLMLALHDRLRAGATLAEALLWARTEVRDDPVAVATGQSFLAFGR
jgi:tetratricopeptide (TPR) repeat protein